MSSSEGNVRRHAIPILYTKGTHYDVGFDVGRTFGSIIHSFLERSSSLNEDLLPAYHTPEGRKKYEDTLVTLKANFPQYIREIQGTADGAKIPFHKLFLLHLDRIITVSSKSESIDSPPIGCSSISVNEPGNETLGHTEDALAETLNHFYFVSAHIISEKPEGRWGVTEEKFTSLCYAGQLPGYTMSYNHHGLVFSINTLTTSNVYPGKTPRVFVTRALLAAENFEQAQKIIRDSGVGAGDGCSINMTFLKQDGNRLLHNAEMGPPAKEEKESQLNILTLSAGEYTMHFNSYLRLSTPEVDGHMKENSMARMETLKTYPQPKNKKDVAYMLGDQSGTKHRVFQDFGPFDMIKTIAVGIFDLAEKTWSIYADNPRKHEPLIVLPLMLKK